MNREEEKLIKLIILRELHTNYMSKASEMRKAEVEYYKFREENEDIFQEELLSMLDKKITDMVQQWVQLVRSDIAIEVNGRIWAQ